ncbi:GNAT family N-acetyltransferase [Nocardia sp. NPDC088792]|uniref:GNAT family N-acetyltransferase n=1 Tax=Nocardia sp. NPDC088792 TaxID=3364332 RepID=UPI0038030C11
MRIRRLESHADLLAVATADHLVSASLEPYQFTVAWAGGDGTVAFGGSDRGPGLVEWLTVIGAGASELLSRALAELPCPPQGISVPRGTDLGGLRLTGYEQWDQMVRSRDAGIMARLPGEARVLVSAPDPLVDKEIRELLALANPTHSVRPGDSEIELWAVVRDEAGALVGCGAYCRRGGVGWLASIATLPSARAQGIGAAVSARLTRHSLSAGDRLCALHHWHPNESARRIYLGLGYTTTHRMTSGEIDCAA